MVVGYLFGIAHLLGKHLIRGILPVNSRCTQNDCRDTSQHIVRQIAAVRSGIGTQLLFIERLQIVQGLLGGVPQKPVGISLEGGQVIECRGFFFFITVANVRNHSILVLAFLCKLLGFRSVREFLAGNGEIREVQIHGEEIFGNKSGDFRFPLHQQRQRGRHDPSYIQLGAVKQRKVPSGVDAHQPVRLSSAQSAFVQPIKIRARAQILEALPDGFVLH